MARTVVEYVKQFLNTSASSSVYGSTEAATGLPIPTGISVGQWFELSDGDAAKYSSLAVVGVQIVTAGSGQTNGTYTAATSNSGSISYTVSGNAVTAVSVLTAGNPSTTAPTATLAANGGTAGTVNLTWGKLYAGVYAWVQLDSAVVATTIAPGTALYWLESASNFTVTTTIASNAPDYAGVVIDPNFGATLPYAFIQIGPGKATVLFNGTLTNGGTLAYGDTVTLKQTTGTYTTTFDDIAALGATTAFAPDAAIGFALAAPVAGTTGLVRVTRPQARF